MKKNFILLGLAWFLGLNHALADNFVISDVTVPQGGTASLVIGYNFTSETDKVGFTLSMELPEGLSLKKDGDGDMVYVKDASINKLNITFAGEGNVAGQPSSETSTITGTSGTLLTLTLVADASLAVNSELTVPVTKATFQQRVSGSVTDINVADFSFKVTIGKPEDSRVILDENSTTAPEASSGAVDVRVKRTITAGNWSSICLPFAMTAAQVTAAFGDDVELADFTGYDVTEEGGKTVGITVNFFSVSAIEANHPYIIKISSPTFTEFTVDGVTVAPVAKPEVNFGTTKNPKSFVGTYVADFDFYDAAKNYPLFLYGNKFYYATDKTKHMKAFRGYFDFVDYLDEAEGSAVKMFVFVDDEETHIEGLESEQLTGDDVYDIMGRKVSKPNHKGVYIVGGKKKFFK